MDILYHEYNLYATKNGTAERCRFQVCLITERIEELVGRCGLFIDGIGVSGILHKFDLHIEFTGLIVA